MAPSGDRITDGIVEWTVAPLADLPDEVAVTVEAAWLDTVGVISRATVAAAEAGALSATCMRPGGSSSGHRTALGFVDLPQTAAFVHAALAHSLDFDDSHTGSGTHPSAVIMPVAWVVGAETGAAYPEVIAACAKGYEVFLRLGAAAPAMYGRHGFHPTSILGAAAATATAAALRRLGPAEVRAAIGLAASLSSGTFRPLIEGREGKSFSVGNAASGAVTAVQLAMHGIPPMDSPLHAEGALLDSLLGEDAVRLDVGQFDDLGSRWMTPEIVFKRFPAAQGVHCAVDAAIELHLRRAGRTDDIDSVVIDVPDYLLSFVWDPVDEHRLPRSGYAAKFNLPYVVAAALCRGRLEPEDLEGAELRDPEVERLARLARLERRDPFPEFPHSYPARVTIGCGNVVDSVRVGGDPGRMSGALEAKARAGLAVRLGQDRAGEAIASWHTSRHGTDWISWMDRVLGAGTSTHRVP